MHAISIAKANTDMALKESGSCIQRFVKKMSFTMLHSVVLNPVYYYLMYFKQVMTISTMY